MVDSDSDTRKTLEELLHRHGLEKSELSGRSPAAAVRNEIAVELESWEACQRLCREGFRFTDPMIAAIAREKRQESERKIASMDMWKKRNSKSATYFDLAQALYAADFDVLVERLCTKCKDRTVEDDSDSQAGPVGGHEECLGPEHPNSQEPSAGAAGTNGLNTQNSDGSRSNGDKLTDESSPSANNTLSTTANSTKVSLLSESSMVCSKDNSDPECLNEQEPNDPVIVTNKVFTQSSGSSLSESKLAVNESPTDATLKLDHSASAESAPDSNSSKVSSKSSSSLPDSENTDQSMSLCFSETMSDELFYSFLNKEGLPTKDCDILKDNGLGPMMFANGFSEKEIESAQPSFTIGGKLLLKRLVKQLSHEEHMVIGELTIKRLEKIGGGSFGSVFKGTWKQKPCAVKVLHTQAQELMTDLPVVTKGDGNENLQLKFKAECEFMMEYKHPNIVDCYATQIYPKCNLPVLVMELMDISLCKYVGGKSDLALEIQISISRDVASALEFLHSKKILHRDLCGDNILLKCDHEIPVAKISDFGMSRLVMKCGSLTHSMTQLGRRGFLPPESPGEYDSSLDVFMFGVVMILVASKVSNVEDKQQRKRCLKEIPNRHPLKQIIMQCISEKKEERPTAAKVHELLKETDVSDFLENESLRIYVPKGSLTKLIGEKVIRSRDLSEVLVRTLVKRGSVIGLFFSAHWCPPSRSFTPHLISWYNEFKKTPNGDLLNIIFISSDANESEYTSYFYDMPWYSLHYDDRKKKNELATKFSVDGIPTLVFVDGMTGNLITRDGRDIIVSDPNGDKFPWSPPSFSEVIVNCKFISRDKKKTAWRQLKGKIVGIFFSFPWSKHRTFKAFSSELIIAYNKLKESGRNFEIIYVNCDKDERAWQEYVENIPWLALPFADEHTMDLIAALDVTQIPTLILLDENGDVITARGSNSVRSDPLGAGFPWYINTLTEETADDIPEMPSLIWFVPNKLKDTAKEILERIAKIYLSTCAEVKAEVNLLFFLSWKSRDEEKYVDYIKRIATLPDCEPLLIILDVAERKVYTCDSHEITNDCVRTFVNDYFQRKITGQELVPMTVYQRRHIEADVLKTCHDGISAAMIDVDAELFGTLLVQYHFASETVLSTSMYSPEIPSELRISYILLVVESTIREAPSSREARELFNTLINVIAEPLGCMEIAQDLVTTCKMKDPTYKSPLKSCAKEKDDTCPRPMDDTKTGYDFAVEGHHLSLLEYIDAGEKKQVKLYDKVAHKWRELGEILGLENSKLDSIGHDRHDDHSKAVAVLQKWMENATNLPRRDKYPMTWTGLVTLLKDCDLGTLAETVDKALTADVNSVKGNMP